MFNVLFLNTTSGRRRYYWQFVQHILALTVLWTCYDVMQMQRGCCWRMGCAVTHMLKWCLHGLKCLKGGKNSLSNYMGQNNVISLIKFVSTSCKCTYFWIDYKTCHTDVLTQGFQLSCSHTTRPFSCAVKKTPWSKEEIDNMPIDKI